MWDFRLLPHTAVTSMGKMDDIMYTLGLWDAVIMNYDSIFELGYEGTMMTDALCT